MYSASFLEIVLLVMLLLMMLLLLQPLLLPLIFSFKDRATNFNAIHP